jgi:ABC-type nitrate/sulfonate/bicarbonate transport system ATPase subunit
MQPRLILLDEPFGALDQQTRLLMGDEVLRMWRETGATVFLITHALDDATMLADRIAVMSARPGRLIDIVETRWPTGIGLHNIELVMSVTLLIVVFAAVVSTILLQIDRRLHRQA